MADPLSAPHRWLDPVAADLGRVATEAPIESAISGPDWLSLRCPQGYLWIFIRAELRLAWWSTHPLPRAWLALLGRHRRSPFAPHLPGRRITRAAVLVDPTDRADGLELNLSDGSNLCARWWPRPGALWLTRVQGDALAQLGRMQGEALNARRPEAPAVATLAASHARACEERLRAHLTERTATLLGRLLHQGLQRARRKRDTLDQDLANAKADAMARRTADLLAAQLHAIPPGSAEVELDDFEGGHLRVELDPSVSAATNLARLYKRAARAERKRAEVTRRRQDTEQACTRWTEQIERLTALASSDPPLEAWLEFAEREGLDPAPKVPVPASERSRPDPRRLPYWTYWLGSEWELRVGRSARDNDILLQQHSHGRDLWLHAQGVTGSHVIVRALGRDVPGRVLDRAARLAAHFSKARSSTTVPVLVCERRHVRKPRKAAPGTVVAERARTVFVEPGIAAELAREGRGAPG